MKWLSSRTFAIGSRQRLQLRPSNLQVSKKLGSAGPALLIGDAADAWFFGIGGEMTRGDCKPARKYSPNPHSGQCKPGIVVVPGIART